MHNYILKFWSCAAGSGLNWDATTAFGITDTICGFSAALRTVFSLLDENWHLLYKSDAISYL